MYAKLTPEEMYEVVSKIEHIEDVFRLLFHLENKFEFVGTLVTRSDVEEEFSLAWDLDPQGRREMTSEQWETFSNGWFWKEGYQDVMWDGVIDAIRSGLREDGVLPNG